MVRVLLADDQASFHEVVRSLLEPKFEIVACVCHGKALIEAAAKLKPDVIVTDISMPILNGIDAVERLKRSGSASPVVFLTVHADPDFMSACFTAGALAYVTKARLVEDLLPAIREALHGRPFMSPMTERTVPLR